MPYNVYEITTQITQQGAKLELGEYVGTREKRTRKQFWNTLDEDLEYNAKQLDDKVVSVNQIRLIIRAVKEQLPAISPDRFTPAPMPFVVHHSSLIEQAVGIFDDYELRNFVIDIRKKYDQVIDHVNPDEILRMGWVQDNKTAKPTLAPLSLWRAYEQLEKVQGQPKNELMALVSLLRRVLDIDDTLTAYDKTVDKNFQDWVFRKQTGARKFDEAQMLWLRMIIDYVASSFHIDREDFDLSPFNAQGGLGKMWQLFGGETEEIIEELNEVLAA